MREAHCHLFSYRYFRWATIPPSFVVVGTTKTRNFRNFCCNIFTKEPYSSSRLSASVAIRFAECRSFGSRANSRNSPLLFSSVVKCDCSGHGYRKLTSICRRKKLPEFPAQTKSCGLTKNLSLKSRLSRALSRSSLYLEYGYGTVWIFHLCHEDIVSGGRCQKIMRVTMQSPFIDENFFLHERGQNFVQFNII